MVPDYQNILIIKPSALGDIVHALPVVKALRTRYPNTRISWLVRSEFAPLLECVDGLDEILLFDRKRLGHWHYRPAAFKALCELRQTLKNRQFDVVLDLQGLFRTGLFAWMTRCPRRIGLADCREMAGLFYTQKVARPKDSLHVLDTYFALLKAIGINADPSVGTRFNISDRAAATVRQKLQQAGITDNYLVLVPSSAHLSKCWPAERFASLAERVHNKYGYQVAAVGTLRDKPLVDAIQKHCRLPIADLAGQTGIEELIAVFNGAQAVVSNDTGPGYIAVETGTPTVIIFGHVNPQRVAPYHRPECIAAIDPDERGEGIRTTDPKHDIRNVTVEMVWEKINILLTDPGKRTAQKQ